MDHRETTADEAAGMVWWNRLAEGERARWLAAAGSAVPADASTSFKRQGRAEAGDLS